ncbi:hypothetical protein D8674_033573 [Pyrus ussuriensis x Pyrus communis]|uniref:CCHC-type domain-containing protein n=1 Tax=Pyrus ussuriensis x Pyrus communis TaxID=2448454 RepID=A0A5N5HMD1_9ROSA|nr:hypothetical protein D8674_033573 [Pyrus ussuriensis x Pyrus communis]
MSSSGPPASDPSSEGKLPESVSSDEAMNCRTPDSDEALEIFVWNGRPSASKPPCETKLRQNVDWNSRPGASDRLSVAKFSDDLVFDWYNRGQPKEREKHTEALHLRKPGCLKLVEEDTTPASSEERVSSCPEDTTPPSSEERIPICREDTTPASSEERISSCPEDTTPICPGDTTPIFPEERIPICRADTTPTCPICIHGRHWMSFCPYLRRVPDDVTNIGEGYAICCQVCSLYNNQCGHNMAYATPIFCFVCRSSQHFSRDCPEFKDVKAAVGLIV